MGRAAKTQIACEDCLSTNVRGVEADFEFQYGIGDDEVTLTAQVPFHECAACGLRHTAPGTERLQNASIAKHLGRMSPSEIRSLRECLQMSQSQFAHELHVGEASIKRWELGQIVPRRSSHKLLLDLKLRVEAVASPAAVSRTSPRRFRTRIKPRQVEAAKAFDIRAPFPLDRRAA